MGDAGRDSVGVPWSSGSERGHTLSSRRTSEQLSYEERSEDVQAYSSQESAWRDPKRQRRPISYYSDSGNATYASTTTAIPSHPISSALTYASTSSGSSNSLDQRRRLSAHSNRSVGEYSSSSQQGSRYDVYPNEGGLPRPHRQQAAASIPSVAALVQDLPSSTFASPRAPGSPISTRSIQSRGSISSRASSPRSPSSSTSSGTRSRRRYVPQVTDTQTVARSASQVPEFHYELIIRQQPGKAAAAGLSPPALSRLPIVPSPILQLRVTDENGEPVAHNYVLQNLPYLVCSCSLLPAENGSEPIDFVTQEETATIRPLGGPAPKAGHPLAMLCGTRVYSTGEAVGINGEPGIFFIFWDASVRQPGRYRLKFTLVEALPGSPTLTAVVSEPFSVVQRAEFPGSTTIATTWTRRMHEQGLNVYLPPLGLTSATDNASTS